MSKVIKVTITNEGMTAETEGYKGETCISEIKKLFDSFIEITDFDLKGDYYEAEESECRDVTIKR